MTYIVTSYCITRKSQDKMYLNCAGYILIFSAQESLSVIKVKYWPDTDCTDGQLALDQAEINFRKLA